MQFIDTYVLNHTEIYFKINFSNCTCLIVTYHGLGDANKPTGPKKKKKNLK